MPISTGTPYAHLPLLCRAKLLQSCLNLCNPVDHSPPGSSVHWILQARILDWAAVSFSTPYLGCCNPQQTIYFLTLSRVPFTEKAMAPHSSTVAWKIPWMEEPGRLQSMRSLRVGPDRSDLAAAAPTPVPLPGEVHGA